MHDTAAHLRHTFLTFAALEPQPKAYLASLIPWNAAIVRRRVAQKGRRWRTDARASLVAIRVLRELLSEVPANA